MAPKNVALLREESLKEIEAHIQEIARLAAACNLSQEELFEILRVNLEELV